MIDMIFPKYSWSNNLKYARDYRENIIIIIE